MGFLEYPKNGNNKERNDAIDTINKFEDIDNITNVSDQNSLVDAWVNFFSWYPTLWGSNGDSTKKAIHSALSNVVKHRNALNDTMGMLDDVYGPDDGIPPKNLNAPTPPRHDPLVLDSDKDSFISTVALADSNTYFDITADGIKEKVSWIAANDGILTYDKNENGKIDGINEVFGNLTTSGFDELKELIDSNHNGECKCHQCNYKLSKRLL